MFARDRRRVTGADAGEVAPTFVTGLQSRQVARTATRTNLASVVAALEARRDELAEETLRQIRAESPAYASIEDPALLADVTAHVAENHDALRASLARGTSVSSEDLAFIRPHAALRARRGVPLAEFLHAFRIGHRVIWDAVLDLAKESEEGRAAALESARAVIEFIDYASTHAAEAYLEAQQLLLAEGDRVRRDLLEDLLDGHELAPGPRLAAARAAGLVADASFLLVLAVPLTDPQDELDLRSAASTLARVVGGRVRPLAVVRHDEIVVVSAAETPSSPALSEPLAAAQRKLAEQGLPLAIGVSTLRDDLTHAGLAYAEASWALDRVGRAGGVLCLSDLSAFEYLTTGGDETVRRLVPAQTQAFVAEDLADGGVLTSTVLEYAATNLNAKAAAERLFVHVNTAHYRLARVAEKTGRDMRSLSDVMELLIAIKLAQRDRQAS
jgi:sugar diacid utilization regulator